MIDPDKLMREGISIWYRSFTPDGKVWCESTDSREVAYRSRPYSKYTFQKIVRRYVSSVEDWDPRELDA